MTREARIPFFTLLLFISHCLWPNLSRPSGIAQCIIFHLLLNHKCVLDNLYPISVYADNIKPYSLVK
jgi:hypothetical protein